jgi:hypothetical protein
VCLVGYALAFIVFGSQVSVLGPTIKPLSERLGCDETDLSPLFTALGISCIISGTPSGWLVDRVPTHVVLVGSLIVEVGGDGGTGGVSLHMGGEQSRVGWQLFLAAGTVASPSLLLSPCLLSSRP